MISNIEKKILEIDLTKESISNIESIISQTILGHKRPTTKTKFEGLFRARNITKSSDSELLETSSIWYPDWKSIQPKKHIFNRCSDKGQNFFYCSNFLEATIKELNPKNLDKILIGIFHTKFPDVEVESQYAGIESLRKNVNSSSELKEYKYYSENDKKIDNILSSKFKERISKNENYKYKLSIAFSNILLKNEEIECIIYPSVASNFELINYGLKPSFVDKYLYCADIFQYSIEKTKTEIILTPEKYGEINHNYLIPKNSKITWINNDNLSKNSKFKYIL